MSNLPNLVANTCAGFSDSAQHLYLALIDKYEGWTKPEGELRAFIEADHYETYVGNFLTTVFDGMVNQLGYKPGPHIQQLAQFFADRYRHNYIGKEKAEWTSQSIANFAAQHPLWLVIMQHQTTAIAA